MAIDQCADDSAAIHVVEQTDGTMLWELIPADGSIEVVTAGTKGVRAGTGRGLYKATDGRLSWRAEIAGQFRSSAGQQTGLTTANNGLLLQELVGNVTNTTAYAREVLCAFNVPWIDIVEEGANVAASAQVTYAAGIGVAAGFAELCQLLTDIATVPRRTRVPGGTAVELYTVNPGQTLQTKIRVVTSCAYGGIGFYSPFVPGMRIDCYWLGSSR